MDRKIMLYALCLVASLASLVWGLRRNSSTASEPTPEMEQAIERLDLASQGLREKQALLAARREAADLISQSFELERQNQKLNEEIHALQKQQQALPPSAAQPSQTTETAPAVASPGEPIFEEIILATGTTLKQATVQSTDADSTVFKHSDGVSRIPNSILPVSLLEKLQTQRNVSR